MTGALDGGPARKSTAARALDFAGQLVVSIAEDETRQASVLLRRIHGQKVSARVLIVLAVIAAGALKEVHGDAWKDHVTDYPESLDREEP